jgi:hypothetical protein
MTRNPITTICALIALGLAAVVLDGCSESMLSCIQGSNVTGSDVRRVPTDNGDPFTRINLEGSVDVVLTEGPYSIVVEGDDNLLRLVTTTISGGTLVVDNTECFASEKSLVVRVSLPKLEGVSVEGSSDLGATSGFSSDLLSISSSGSGDIDLQVESKELHTTSTGSGDITLGGHAASHTVVMSGSGDLDAYDLQTERPDYRSSGSGDGTISVSQSLTVTLSGSGDLGYHGNPGEYLASVTGSGEVSRIP